MSANAHKDPEPGDGPNGAAQSGAVDPSMEDILASIRRILSEDEAVDASPPNAGSVDAADEVFALDETMLTREPEGLPPARVAPPVSVEALLPPAPPPPEAVPPSVPEIAVDQTRELEFTPEPMITLAPAQAASEPLVAPEATSAAQASMAMLMRSMTAERQTAVWRGGPTLEDMLRNEMRPMLKNWLDENLPGMVERIVRTEIERMAGRATL